MISSASRSEGLALASGAAASVCGSDVFVLFSPTSDGWTRLQIWLAATQDSSVDCGKTIHVLSLGCENNRAGKTSDLSRFRWRLFRVLPCGRYLLWGQVCDVAGRIRLLYLAKIARLLPTSAKVAGSGVGACSASVQTHSPVQDGIQSDVSCSFLLVGQTFS